MYFLHVNTQAVNLSFSFTIILSCLSFFLLFLFLFLFPFPNFCFQTASFTRAGGAGSADPATAKPMFWLRWCCRPFTCRPFTDPCPHKPRIASVNRTAKTWEQAEFEHGGRTFLLGVAWNKIQTKCEAKYCLAFVCHFFTQFQVYLKPPMAMDTNLHACGHEANQNAITMPGLKWRL